MPLLCAPFPHLPFSFLSLLLCYLFCLSANFYFFLFHVHTWSKGVTSKMQDKKGKNARKKTQAQKGQCSVDRRFSPLEWFSYSLLDFSLEPCIYIRTSFFVSCLGHIPRVWQYLFYNSCALLGHTLGM